MCIRDRNILKLKYFLALTLTLGLFNFDIVAQDEDDVEEVIVTGSRILNDEFSSSSPVTIISEEDILSGGNASVDEFLKYTPAFTGYQLGTSTNNGGDGSNPKGSISQDEPTFTDLEPTKAGNSGDGYVWKYLFTISPSDIIKFDSTEYITVPNSWGSNTDTGIRAVRENGDSSSNNNQIKHVFIEKEGAQYANGYGQEVDIIGDGTGAKAIIDVVNGKITNATVSSGGKGYSYGLVDLGTLNSNVSTVNRAKLIPIIPPSLGHGYDIYTELGTDRVLIYARFDDSTKDFPTDAKFAQVGIVKNPTKIGTAVTYTDNTFSSLQAVKFSSVTGTPQIGEEIKQTLTVAPNNGKIATAYVCLLYTSPSPRDS